MKEEREISGMVDQVKMNHYKAPLVVAHDFCPNSKKKKNYLPLFSAYQWLWGTKIITLHFRFKINDIFTNLLLVK